MVDCCWPAWDCLNPQAVHGEETPVQQHSLGEASVLYGIKPLETRKAPFGLASCRDLLIFCSQLLRNAERTTGGKGQAGEQQSVLCREHAPKLLNLVSLSGRV